MNHLRTSQVIKLYVLVHSTRWISGIKWRDYYYFLIWLSKRTNEWTGQVWHFHIYGQFFCWEGRPPNLHAPWAQPQNIHKRLNYQPPGQQDNELWHYCVPLWESPPGPHRLHRTRVAVIAAPLLHNSRSKVSPGGRSVFLHLIADHLRLPRKENEDGGLTRNILTFSRTLTVVMETEKPQPLAKKGLAK